MLEKRTKVMLETRDKNAHFWVSRTCNINDYLLYRKECPRVFCCTLWVTELKRPQFKPAKHVLSLSSSWLVRVFNVTERRYRTALAKFDKLAKKSLV